MDESKEDITIDDLKDILTKDNIKDIKRIKYIKEHPFKPSKTELSDKELINELYDYVFNALWHMISDNKIIDNIIKNYKEETETEDTDSPTTAVKYILHNNNRDNYVRILCDYTSYDSMMLFHPKSNLFLEYLNTKFNKYLKKYKLEIGCELYDVGSNEKFVILMTTHNSEYSISDIFSEFRYLYPDPNSDNVEDYFTFLGEKFIDQIKNYL